MMGILRCSCKRKEMPPKSYLEMKRFFIRLLAVAVAVLLIMFLAKIWLVDPYRQNLSSSAARGYRNSGTRANSGIQPGNVGVITWRDAAKHYGEYTIVEGTIVVTHNSGKACFLNFHHDYSRYFTAVIFASAFSRFPPKPENYYYGKKVRVSGFIKKYQGKPEIIVDDQSQIEVLGSQE